MDRLWARLAVALEKPGNAEYRARILGMPIRVGGNRQW